MKLYILTIHISKGCHLKMYFFSDSEPQMSTSAPLTLNSPVLYPFIFPQFLQRGLLHTVHHLIYNTFDFEVINAISKISSVKAFSLMCQQNWTVFFNLVLCNFLVSIPEMYALLDKFMWTMSQLQILQTLCKYFYKYFQKSFLIMS